MNIEVQPVKKGRGRPKVDKVQQQVETVKNNVFTKDFVNSDGTTDRWYYDFNKYPTKGLYKTEMDIYNKEPMPVYQDKRSLVNGEVDLVNNMNVPKTKRLYINPINGKTVGYTRARMLGLID